MRRLIGGATCLTLPVYRHSLLRKGRTMWQLSYTSHHLLTDLYHISVIYVPLLHVNLYLHLYLYLYLYHLYTFTHIIYVMYIILHLYLSHFYMYIRWYHYADP